MTDTDPKPKLNINRSAIERLADLRVDYQCLVNEHLRSKGLKVDDLAISAPGCLFICAATNLWVGLPDAAPVRVLELGGGFSTVALCFQQRVELHTRDHDPQWIVFLREMISRLDPVINEADASGILSRRPQWESARALKPRTEAAQGLARHGGKPYQVIILDQGPSLAARAECIAWAHRLLAADGAFLFDDWRPKHEGRLRRALAAIPGKWHIGHAEQTRRTRRDKAIGWATRDATVGDLLRALPEGIFPAGAGP